MDGDIADLAAAVMASAGAKKASGGPFTPADFCVWVAPEPEEATLDEVVKMFEMMGKNANG